MNTAYESEEGEVQFCGRGRGLGEIAAAEIIHNEENADQADGEKEYQEPEVSDGENDGEIGMGKVQNRQDQAQISNLAPVPAFEQYEHPKPQYKRTLNLSVEFSGRFDPVRNPEPDITRRRINFFTLFLDEEEFENLTQNTNSYATVKEVGQGGSRTWQAAEREEILIFLGLRIYMGLYHTSTVPDYWRKDSFAPLHR